MTNAIPPKVSVCIPVYNGSEYIKESIDSVLAQTYKNFELIVCDNCSTDNTGEIVRNYNNPGIRYVRNQKNLGGVGNANRCLELATGEYISIWHHDDCMMPDNLERKVRVLDEHPDVGFVHSNLILIDEKGTVVSPNIWNEDSRHDYVENGMDAFRKFMSCIHLGANVFVGAVLARRECYDRIGAFSTELPHVEDVEMWLRMSLFYNVACIGTPLVKYRVHLKSMSSGFGDYETLPYLKEHYLAARIIFEKYSDRIPQVHELKRQVLRSFGERAISFAYNAFSSGNFTVGKSCLREALRMYPKSYQEKSFWKSSAMLMAGPNGVKLYHYLIK